MSRKVFWVDAGDLENFQQSFEIEEVDTSDVVPPRRKRSAWPCPVSSEILSEIKNVNKQVAKTFKISSKQQIPMGLLNAAEKSFSCTVCKVCPPKPSLICCRSCCSIVGCESCVNRWYGRGQATLTKICSKCRQERGFANTFELKSLSLFLQELDKFVNDETEHDGSLDATIPNWQETKKTVVGIYTYIHLYMYRSEVLERFFLRIVLGIFI